MNDTNRNLADAELSSSEVRQIMISCLDKMIAGLQRNREILASGGRLENEHWADVAGELHDAMLYFGNQDKFICKA